MLLFILIVPEVSWIGQDITIGEGESGQVCFVSSTGSAQDYTVVIGARGKDSNQATRKKSLADLYKINIY
jgi:hypothetical protein